MLGQMAWKTRNPAGEMHRPFDRPVGEVIAALLNLMLLQLAAMMTPDRIGQLAGDILSEAEQALKRLGSK